MFTQPLLVICVFIAILLYPYAMLIWQRTQRVALCQRVEAANAADFPVDISEVLAPYIQEFELIDFELAQYVSISSSTAGTSPLWGVLLRDVASQHYACLAVVPASPSPQNIFVEIFVEFTTFLADDRILLTTSAKKYGLFKAYPPEIKQHLVDAPIQELWHAHQAKVTGLSLMPISLTTESFLQRLEAHGASSMQFSVQHGRFCWVDVGVSYRYRLIPAIKIVFHAFWTVHFARKARCPLTEAEQQDRIQYEATDFLESQVPQAPMSKRKRGWLALGSLAIFAAVYATKFGPTTLIIFLAALILHEGGHLLAMLIFGYRSPAVLFIPYLGALATARKDHASLTEKVWISLAGPLPGLILGVAIAIFYTQGLSGPMALSHWYGDGNLWREASQILIALNLFNLLPIYPLDGGQISDLLVFSRNPYLGVIYKSIGVSLLLLLGLFSPLMFVFGLLMALTIPSSFRVARWFAKLRGELRQIPWQDDVASAELIFTRLQAAPKLSPVQKSLIAAGIFESRRANTASWSSRLGLSAIYLVSLFAGITGGLYAIMPDLRMVASTLASTGQIFQGPGGRFREQVKKDTETIAQNPKDLKAYLRRGYARSYLKDFQGAIDDANVILSQDPQSIKAYQLRAGAYRELGDRAKSQADEHKAQEIQWMPQFQKAQAALKKNPKDLRAYIDRADAKDGLDDREGAFQDLEIALKINPKSTEVLLMRSSLFERQQNYPAALKDLNRVIELEPNNADAYGLRGELYDQLGEDAKAKADEAKSLELFAQSSEGKANPKMVEAMKRLQSLPRDD
jgi:tetratricopeptide (TPR) repeat protein/Zn-dependent protease